MNISTVSRCGYGISNIKIVTATCWNRSGEFYFDYYSLCKTQKAPLMPQNTLR